MKRILIFLVIVLFTVSGCITIGGPKEEKIQQIKGLDGVWTGNNYEAETFGNCKVRSSGRLTATFIVNGNSFTGSFLSDGSSVSLFGSCGGGEYNNIGTISGTLAEDGKIIGTINIEGLQLPFSALFADGLMAGSYAGSGTQEGVTSFYEGNFDLRRN